MVLSQDVGLLPRKTFQNDLHAIQFQMTVVGDIATHAGQFLLPYVYQDINPTLANVERGHVRKEIVSNEEDEEDPVVDGHFKVKGEWGIGYVESNFEILAQNGHIEEDEALLFGRDGLFGRTRSIEIVLQYRVTLRCLMSLAAARMTPCFGFGVCEDIFAKHAEVRLVSGKGKHN